MEIEADRILIDEEEGREVAARMELLYIGIMGLLLEAKRRGHLAAVRPVIDDLVSIAGFWIGKQLRREILEAAGETEV